MNTSHKILTLVLLATLSLAAGCGTPYITPGKPAEMETFSQGKPITDLLAATDLASMQRGASRMPSASLPAKIALVRVQAPDYQSYTIARPASQASFAVITTREVEEIQDFREIQNWAQVAAVEPLNNLLTGRTDINTAKDLRKAAMPLMADMIFVYTLDTVFTKENNSTPLAKVMPGDNIQITTTATGLLTDAKTGYLYAAVQADAKHITRTTGQTKPDAIDKDRKITERNAFINLLGQLEKTWPDVVKSLQNK